MSEFWKTLSCNKTVIVIVYLQENGNSNMNKNDNKNFGRNLSETNGLAYSGPLLLMKNRSFKTIHTLPII